MSQKLAGKVAVVTGASKGIGAGIAKQLAADGAAVVVNYASSKAGADKVVDEIKKSGGRAIAVQADFAKPDDIKKLFAATKKEFDKLDILVNNAGVYEFGPLEQITPEHFHRMFDLNVLGLLLATQEAVKLFGKGTGSVINISSVAATAAPPTICRLQRHEGSRRRHHSLARTGTRPTRHSRQLGEPWHDRNRRLPHRRPRRRRLPQASRSPNTARPHRSAGRCRPDGRVPGFRRRPLDHRRNVLRLRRPSLKTLEEGVCLFLIRCRCVPPPRTGRETFRHGCSCRSGRARAFTSRGHP